MGVSLTPPQLKKLLDILPQIKAAFQIFKMDPNVYYEGNSYRIYYNKDTKEFVNIDDMLKFQIEDLDENDCEKVSSFILIETVLYFWWFKK
jgi:DNA-directed RNA polymerase subunit E'/Rpb7